MEENIPNPTRTTVETPNTFYTLPRELRQKILYHTCGIEYATEKKISPITMHEFQKIDAKDEKFRYKVWSKILTKTFGGDMKEDVEYVARRWDREVENDLDECLNGSGTFCLSMNWSYNMKDLKRHVSLADFKEL